MERRSAVVFAVALMSGVLAAGTAAAQTCPVKIGGVLPLTGSMAPITKKIAQAAGTTNFSSRRREVANRSFLSGA